MAQHVLEESSEFKERVSVGHSKKSLNIHLTSEGFFFSSSTKSVGFTSFLNDLIVLLRFDELKGLQIVRYNSSSIMAPVDQRWI